MVEYVKSLLDALELPYRVARLCGGDLGFTSALTYDMEVYSAAQERWLEVSSISNFETFQANRLKLRFKNEDGSIVIVVMNDSNKDIDYSLTMLSKTALIKTKPHSIQTIVLKH